MPYNHMHSTHTHVHKPRWNMFCFGQFLYFQSGECSFVGVCGEGLGLGVGRTPAQQASARHLGAFMGAACSAGKCSYSESSRAAHCKPSCAPAATHRAGVTDDQLLRHLMLCYDYNFSVLDARPYPDGERVQAAAGHMRRRQLFCPTGAGPTTSHPHVLRCMARHAWH